MNFYSCIDSIFSDVDYLCVAIQKISNSQNHVGLFFKDSQDQTKLLHQPWHYRTLLTNPTEEYIWFDVELDEFNKMHLATFCALIAEQNEEGIAYSLCSNGTRFSPDGSYSTEIMYTGLTCSTFVMQVFDSQGFQILDKKSWKNLPADKTWMNQIIQKVKQSEADKKFLSYQRKRIQEGVSRFRPEQVAAALNTINWPHTPSSIREPANQVVQCLNDFEQALKKE
jgi:hypothetical protein